MSGNTYGKSFTLTTFGESHGAALGCVIDGCPPGLAISKEYIQVFLDQRKPGASKYTTQRKEEDLVEILSGVFEGKTTGTQAEFGTVDANPAGRYPSNIIGDVGESEQKYFYAPRATRKEKGDFNNHPTVKPVSLMEYLIRIYSPEGSTVLDPFIGSGSTAVAANNVNRKCIGIDLSQDYVDITNRRIQ